MAIDLRSDTMTQPTPEMKQFMCQAVLGDDVWGEDPTILAFQEEVAKLLGKEAALFLPTATQSNLIAIMSHCQRGEEYIVGNEAHCYRWEAGGAAVLGSVQPQPISFEADGTLDLQKVAGAIKPDDPHFAISRLLCIENTQGGKVLPLDYIKEARVLCNKNELKLHMDGARLFNASVFLKTSVGKIAEHVDSVTLCFSKGLGCPAGAMLVADRELIKRALRWRKILGGAFRQGGILAAAAQYALAHHVEGLDEDHKNATLLAEGLRSLEDPRIRVTNSATNMVFIEIEPSLNGPLQSFAKEHGLLLSMGTELRLVTHRDVNRQMIERAITIFQKSLSQTLAASSSEKGLY